MLQFILSTQDAIRVWRDAYFDSLDYSQDMYSESMISWMPNAAFYVINRSGCSIGYIILNQNNELVEFYIQNDQLSQKESLFMDVVKQFGIKNVYCKSFDHTLLSCCLAYAQSYKLVGHLFQHLRPQGHAADCAMNVRLATLEDVSFLNSFENEILEDGEDMTPYVENKSVYMFLKGEELIGCGYLFNVIPGRKYCDVGMWVNQLYRGQGYATQIISYLTAYCLEHHFIPTAGCADDNIASRRTLEKCGFVSRWCLINFEFQV